MKKIKSHYVLRKGAIIKVKELEPSKDEWLEKQMYSVERLPEPENVFVAKYPSGSLDIISKEEFEKMEKDFEEFVKNK